MNTNKPKDLKLKNKIYVNLVNLGYPKDIVLQNLNNYIA